MNELQFVITIYIRPDKGPISEMKLDMLAIDTEAMQSTTNGKNDERRLDKIAEKITEKFPKVEPQRKLNELRLLIARLSHVSLFDGVVLRLPGEIDGSTPPQQQAFPSPEDFKRL